MRTRRADASKAVGYVRVSTEDQSLSPDAQRDALARWCQERGVELVAVHEDLGISGGSPIERRPGLLAAVDALAVHGAGVLLVAKRDRLARDVMVSALVERLAERNGARIYSADGTGNGEGPEAMLLRGLVDLFAQYERAMIRTRTSAALAVKRTRSERTGQVPFGYRLSADGVHVETDPQEQAVVELVRSLRADGLSLRAIADALNNRQTPSRGQRWHVTTIARMVERIAA